MSDIRWVRQNNAGAGVGRFGARVEWRFTAEHPGCGGTLDTDSAAYCEHVSPTLTRWVDCRCTKCDGYFTMESEDVPGDGTEPDGLGGRRFA